jgi:glutaconate CoA-transferase, subunit A
VTVERIEDTNFLEDAALAAGTISSLYVSAISVVPNGARPIGLVECYAPDSGALSAYALAAKTQAGFSAWLKARLGQHAMT